MTVSENLALWREVERTDPDAVKPIIGKPYVGNSPKPHWLFFRATEIFGPCGLGWGVKIISERIVSGSESDKVHIAHVLLWYLLDGKRGEIEHVGQTMFYGTRSNGKAYTDEDAPKKSVTDATVKALSMIGFAGDIFSGRWDDDKYVAAVRAEIAEQRSEQRCAAELPDLLAYEERCLRAIEAEETRDGLISYWNGQKSERETLQIYRGEQPYERLFAAYKKKGRGFTQSKIAASESEELLPT